MKTDILGVKVDVVTMSEAIKIVKLFLKEDKVHYITTPNPEILVYSQNDSNFRTILNNSDLAIADGIGLVIASFFSNKMLPERVTGVDLMERICSLAEKDGYSVFLLGGRHGAGEETAYKLKRRYPKLTVAGVHEDVFKGGADIVFVAYGAPKQEEWIYRYISSIDKASGPFPRLLMGVGGSFDFISGRVKRAPNLIRKIGFEWLWRFAMEPRRVGRICNATIVFPYFMAKSVLKL